LLTDCGGANPSLDAGISCPWFDSSGCVTHIWNQRTASGRLCHFSIRHAVAVVQGSWSALKRQLGSPPRRAGRTGGKLQRQLDSAPAAVESRHRRKIACTDPKASLTSQTAEHRSASWKRPRERTHQ